MATAMTLISSQVLSTTASSVTFNSFSGYRDLRLVAQIVMTNSSVQTLFTVNGDTGANYGRQHLSGWGSSGAVNAKDFSSQTNIALMNYSAPANTVHTLVTADFYDYSQTDKQKSMLFRSNHTTEVGMVAARWASTSAITSITLTPDTATFAAGSTFYLYGVSA